MTAVRPSLPYIDRLMIEIAVVEHGAEIAHVYRLTAHRVIYDRFRFGVSAAAKDPTIKLC
ncbi:hypothetical protein M8997_004145 [Phyllobacterium sp. 21LDTY02-6]|uniref:hypothetical protein n=1 Tax=Phyllobacterium sp. 21LDTY02-6 TaxID=2944903 RepID=UPI00202033AC|nr:hypothetical protein [Phyllobacterium sp. 21LDTY02-6]MCO4316364.1 hypothetical protein [Phyllobacterium sp. 21LDTY02-6]